MQETRRLRNSARFLLLVAGLLPACGVLEDVRSSPRADAESALADAVNPLRAAVDDATTEAAKAEVSQRLQHAVANAAPPEQIREFRPVGSIWVHDSEELQGRRHVGTAVGVVRDDGSSYCVGVTIDSQLGPVFSRSDSATLDNDCAGIDEPPVGP